MRTLRVYVDTSVVGGCFDNEFEVDSLALIQMAKDRRVLLLVSRLLVEELKQAPDPVQKILVHLPSESFESVEYSEEAQHLRDVYLAAKVVGELHHADAYHVALATVARADMIVSWNFKHIVHFDKIRGFNAVNLSEGYWPIAIHSPQEIV